MNKGIHPESAKDKKNRLKALARPDGLLAAELPGLSPPAETAHPKKQSEGFHKVSKRTTPGGDLHGSAPQHVHSEGKRWMSNLRKQDQTKRKIFQRKSQKGR